MRADDVDDVRPGPMTYRAFVTKVGLDGHDRG
jgi:hypothetical protein